MNRRRLLLDLPTFFTPQIDLSPLYRVLPDLEVVDTPEPEQAIGLLQEAQVLIINKFRVNEAFLRAVKPELISLLATGYDNVDVEAARAQGTQVCNIVNYATPSVAQHTLMMMLTLATRFIPYRKDVCAGAWQRHNSFSLLTHPISELKGRVLGIVGYGVLGREVARLARAFGMKVCIARRDAHDTRPRRLALECLLARADFVSLHCPATHDNHHFIGAKELAMMQSSAYLMNTARGSLVDAQALAQALRDGTIAGAAVDVLEQEPPAVDHPLLSTDVPNLIVTPHIAWASVEARQRAVIETAKNLRAWQQGKPRNLVWN